MLNRVNPPRAVDLGYASVESHDAGGFDPREAINFVWRQWRFISGVTALALLISALYVARQTPLYTASAQLLLDPQREKITGQDPILTAVALDSPTIESQIAVIRSTSLLRRVVVKERLLNDPEFGAGPAIAGGGLLASIREFFSHSSSPPPTPRLNDTNAADDATEIAPDVMQTIQNLAGAVGVTRAGQALVLNVAITSADPPKAARLANAVADAYVVDKLEARFEAAKRASAWLSDRLVELGKQLRDSEEAVARFRADNNLVVAGGGSNTTLNQEQLGQLNGRLVAARAETAEKRARLDLLEKVQAAGGVVADLPDIANVGAIPDLRRQENDLRRQEADLLARYSDRHPAVVNVRAQLADIQRAIAAEAARLASDVKQDYDLASTRQLAVEKTLHDVTGQTDLDAAKAITLRELERSAAVNRTLFEDFLQRAKVTEEQSTFEARDARIITPAQTPTSASSPKTAQITLASLALGLIAGVGGAYLIELLNAGFTTPRQVEEMLELPLLASVSRMETRDLTAEGVVMTMPEYPVVKPLSRFSEAFRSLRSAVQMSDVDNPPKVVAVTSTIPREGKSTIAMTMAASAAQSGLKALLIDGDLRHPSASRYFATDKELGLVDYLVSDADLEQILIWNDKLRHWFLPSGSKTQNPPDLLASDRFKALIASLRERFDLIVIDTPPLGPMVAALDPRERFFGRTVNGVRIVGAPGDLRPIVREYAEHGICIDEVWISDELIAESPETHRALSDACRLSGLKCSSVSGALNLAPARSESEAGAEAAVRVAVAPAPGYFRLRRPLEAVAAAALLAALAPVAAIVAAIVVIDLGAPVVFWQERIGRNERKFLLYKFRTFHAPFDRTGEAVPRDRRTSWIGQIVRKSRLDEIPQLWNVVRGEMALIGPRPLLPVDQPDDPRTRLLVRPGITGWAQVNGGTALTAEEKDALDSWYIRNASPVLDLRVVWRTVSRFGRGERRDASAIERAMEWRRMTKGGDGRLFADRLDASEPHFARRPPIQRFGQVGDAS